MIAKLNTFDNKITMDIPAHVPAEVMTQMRAYAAKAFHYPWWVVECHFFVELKTTWAEDGRLP